LEVATARAAISAARDLSQSLMAAHCAGATRISCPRGFTATPEETTTSGPRVPSSRRLTASPQTVP
jgi:hypothetical protein